MVKKKEFDNLKVKDIDVADTNGQYILIVKEDNPFAVFSNDDIEYRIMLFSRQNGKIDESAVERTQETLREQLNDDSIVFTDPEDATGDDNHFEQWVKRNVNAPINLVTQDDNGYKNLGYGGSGSSFFGDSKYLDAYEGGAFDPMKNRTILYNTLTDRQKDAVDTMDEQKYPEIYKSKSGNFVSLNIDGVVTDVILTQLDNQDARPERLTRQEIREDVIESLTSGRKVTENNKYLAEQIEALPEGFAYFDLVSILGGTSAENVEERTKKTAISGLLSTVDRTSMRMHIQNPETGMVFQSTALRIGKTKGAMESDNKLQFEYVTGDPTMRDYALFLTKLAKLPITEMHAQDIMQELVDNGFHDADTGSISVNDSQSMLDASRALLKGRRVKIASTLYSTSSNGLSDTGMLNTKLRGLMAEQNPDNIQTGLVYPGKESTQAPANTEQDVAEDPFQSLKPEDSVGNNTSESHDVQNNPFVDQDEKEESANPFGDDQEETDEVETGNPFADDSDEESQTEEEAEDTSDEEEKDLIDNPFK